MPTIKVNDYDMSYVEVGTGPALVLIHGTLCDSRYWGMQLGALSAVHRVIAVSLRHCFPERWSGHGDDYTIAQHSEDIGQFLAALAIGPVHLLGHSRGGLVAFEAARKFPSRIRSLVLADAGGELGDELTGGTSTAQPIFQAVLRECAELVSAGDIDGALRRFSEGINGPGAWSRVPEIGKQMMRDNARTLLGQAAESRPPYTVEAIQRVRAPTLLINGERSGGNFHAISEALLRYLPNGRRVIIANTGHTMNVEQPAPFNSAVLEFTATV